MIQEPILRAALCYPAERSLTSRVGLEKSRLFSKKTGPVVFFGFYWLFLKKAGFYYHHFFKDFTAVFLIF